MISGIDAHKRRMQSADWIGASPWNLMDEIFGIVISILVLAFAVFAGLNKPHENRGDQ
jgi:hypothetical protein